LHGFCLLSSSSSFCISWCMFSSFQMSGEMCPHQVGLHGLRIQIRTLSSLP
jgi:hypothetical protein